MRFVSYILAGRASYGICGDAGIVDLGEFFGAQYSTLRAAIAGNALDELAEWAHGKPPDAAIEDVEFLPLIPDAEKVICFGLNYRKRNPVEGDVTDMEFPNFFLKPPGTLVGHDRPMVKPLVSDHFDYEGELAVIIGRAGRHIDEGEALDYVAGYSCLNDGSVRDWQRHSVNAGKNFEASGSCGPWMTTADEIDNPDALQLTALLNGNEMQNESTGLMFFDVRQQISYVSKIMELKPGDILATGSPEGSGARRDPPIFMKEGDVVEVELSGIGTLRNPIINE